MAAVQIIPIRRRLRGKGRRSGGLLASHDDSPPWSGTPAAPAESALQDPIAFAMRFMVDPAKPDALRVSMAKTAMQYMYGRSAPPLDGYDIRARNIARMLEQAQGDTEQVAPCPTHAKASSRLAAAHETPDDSAAHAAMEARIRLLEERARAAEARADEIAQLAAEAGQRLRDRDEQAAAAAARLREMEERARAAEAAIATIKAVRPDVFDESGAVVPLDTEAQESFAQLVQLEEHLRKWEKRATLAEGRLREAERRARDAEERACAAEVLIAGYR
jgi:hypothetical protein